VVYKAENRESGEVVAIKVLFPSVKENDQFLERFLREARTVCKLQHENIIQGIESGEHDGLYYFVMEYVDGRTLREIHEEEGPFREKRVIDLSRQVTRALKHADEHGLVHRDVKPENIMINQDGVVKLCDLGLAKKTKDEAKSVTRTGTSVGTPYYMSPEQASGETDIDIRTDIYSLGATMYLLLSDQVPFDGKTSAEIMTKHLNENLIPPRQVNPDVSMYMDRVVQKMMQKQRGDRYQSPDQLLEDLNRISVGREPEHALLFRDKITRYLPGMSGGVTRKNMVRFVLVGSMSLGLIVAILYITSEDTGTSNTDGSEIEKTVRKSETTSSEEPDRRSTSSETKKGDDVTDPPRETKKSGQTVSSAEQEKPTDPVNRESPSLSDEQKRKRFQRLKTAVTQFDGGVEDVRDLTEKIRTFKARQNNERWRREAEKLSDRFLNVQATSYYKNALRSRMVAAKKKGKLERAYTVLEAFPDVFEGTETWKTIKKTKKQLLQKMKTRIRDAYGQIDQLLENNKFNKARSKLRGIRPMLSSKLTPDLVDRYDRLKKEIRTRHRKTLKRYYLTALNTFQFFQINLQAHLTLHQKSIFDIDLQRLPGLIKKYQDRIPFNSFRKKIEEYRKDIRLLKLYKKLLTDGIKKAIQNRETIELKSLDGARPITERNGNKLMVQIQGQAKTGKKISSLSFSRRLKFAGQSSRKDSARKNLALGLAAYYANRPSIATEWFERAKKEGTEGADMYLNRVSEHPTHRMVTLMMQEMNQAIETKEKLKVDVLRGMLIDRWQSDVYDGPNRDQNRTPDATRERGPSTDWFDTDWGFRRKITIAPSTVEADLANFPILIDTARMNGFQTSLKQEAQKNGDDILFTNVDGTPLDHEIESYDGNSGALTAWVRLDSVSSTSETAFFVYYGNPDAANQESKADTWNSDYAGVWHLDEAPADGAAGHEDSTSNDNTGIPVGFRTGKGTTDAPGKISGADRLDGIDDHIILNRTAAGVLNVPEDGTYTISAWVKIDAFDGSHHPIVSKGDHQYVLKINDSDLWTFHEFNSGRWEVTRSGQGTVARKWVHLVGVRDGTTQKLYKDGSLLQDTITRSGQSRRNESFHVNFGRNSEHTDRFLDGAIDEVRIARTNRSAAWIAASYYNQNNVRNFYTVGTEQTQDR